MLDALADLFLAFSHRPVILLLIIIMGVVYGKEFAFQVMCIVTLAIVLNVSLKGLFQVPLPRPLDSATGFSFPSGHMMVATAFYTWLALYTPYWSLRILMGILLVGIGASLMHYNFHTIWDVLSAFVFGSGLVIAFIYTLIIEKKWSPIAILTVASILMLYNGFIYPVLPIDSWRAFCILAFIIIAEQAVALKTKKYHFWKFKPIPDPHVWHIKNKQQKEKP